jgi:hypothetical protein
MNALGNHYGPNDGRHAAACLIDAVIDFAIEELSDCRGGVITILSLNELEDMTAIYKSESGSICIAQSSLHDPESPNRIDILPEQIDAIVAALKI